MTKKCVFSLNKNLFIPIVCEEEIVYEVEIKNKIIGFKEKETEIKTRLKEQLKEQVGEMFDENKVTFSVVRDWRVQQIRSDQEVRRRGCER